MAESIVVPLKAKVVVKVTTSLSIGSRAKTLGGSYNTRHLCCQSSTTWTTGSS
ncbi:MAG: hypothetical protein RL173_2360 [Fibrobacterota bacterium]|jgi:hypothetical protein